MAKSKMKSHKLYHDRYALAFYDRWGEEFRYQFDNAIDILRWQKKPITREAVVLLNAKIYAALKSPTHFVRFLTDELLTIYLIDIKGDEENG